MYGKNTKIFFSNLKCFAHPLLGSTELRVFLLSERHSVFKCNKHSLFVRSFGLQ